MKEKEKAVKKAKILLVKTIKNDDVENLRKILKSGLPIDGIVEMPGRTALMVCASEGSMTSYNVIMDF